jgi:nucleotidyltransferase-like protein
MREVHESLIAEASCRLAAVAPNAQVILFGSHVHGEASRDSKVDFLVIEPKVANEADESVRLYPHVARPPGASQCHRRKPGHADRWRARRPGPCGPLAGQVLAG